MTTLKVKQFHLIEDMDIAALTLSVVERVEAFMDKISHVVRIWVRRSNDRRNLAMMSDHLLQDIGMSLYDVHQETGKFFWQK